MISAVENFGSVSGAVPSSLAYGHPHHHQQQQFHHLHNANSYILSATAEVSGNSVTLQTPHTPTTPTQLMALQAQQHNAFGAFQQHQAQQQQHLRYVMPSSLPSPPLSSPSSLTTHHNASYLGKSPMGLSSYSPKNMGIAAVNAMSPPQEQSSPPSQHGLRYNTNQSVPMNLATSSASACAAAASAATSCSNANESCAENRLSPANNNNANQASDAARNDNAVSTAAALVAAYQFKLYASNPALYAATAPAHLLSAPNPAVSIGAHAQPSPSAATHAPVAGSYYMNPAVSPLATHIPAALAPMPPSASGANANPLYSVAYLKAIQNAVANSMLALAHPNNEASSNVCNSSSPALHNSYEALYANGSHETTQNSKLPLKPKAQPAAAAVVSTTGTYLNDKVKSNDCDADNFKVPNGKEGSLKHRILTNNRSAANANTNADKEAAQHTSVMKTHNSTASFRKGAYIELANGVLRRVEDMRTEDFIQCAERSPIHQLAESTVVKINTKSSNIVVITFSYDKNRSKVDMEVSNEHPFFVYGQGWASSNPELSLKTFGLKCQRLQVGDICISLTQRDSNTQQRPQSTQPQTQQYAPSNGMLKKMVPPTAEENKNLIPQALGPKPTIDKMPMPTAQFSSMLSSAALPALFAGAPPHLNLPPGMSYSEMAEMVAASYASNNLNPFMLPPPAAANYYQQQHMHHHAASVTHKTAPANSATAKEPMQQSLDGSYAQDNEQPLDASISRKRRWSAPESTEEDDDEADAQKRAMTAAQMSHASSYKALKTSAAPAAACSPNNRTSSSAAGNISK